MKSAILTQLTEALVALKTAEVVPSDAEISVQVEHTKSPTHGDFATNLPFLLAKICGKPPRVMAETLLKALPASSSLEKTEIAGAGFINFYLKKGVMNEIVAAVLKAKDQFGAVNIGQGQKVHLEFVSANPTGPLHVGHGRGAAFGASLANILRKTGYAVTTEYYVNDAGRQMDILALSVWLRYLALAKEPVIFPVNAYQGEYVIEIAKALFEKDTPKYIYPFKTFAQDLPSDETAGGDKELYIDACIQRAKTLLKEEGFHYFHQAALDAVLHDIQEDLKEFGVVYDHWFSERQLYQDDAIKQSVKALEKVEMAYPAEGAIWFKSTQFGDEKDRVLIRENQQPTYFASDIAYHWDKYHRGFERVIDIFGADHHGYVTRIQSSMKALGHDDQAMQVILVQFATLFRGKERVQMSTRSGSFVTLRALREEVGNDAARFFYVLRKPEQHMEFDLELAKSQSQDNPVYYIQYAHARICSVLEQLKERGLAFDEKIGVQSLSLLTMPQETQLMNDLVRYPEMIEAAAKHLEPHVVAYYLRQIANSLHVYYNAVTLLCEEEPLRHARLCLLKAVAIVIQQGLQLLGVSAPRRM